MFCRHKVLSLFWWLSNNAHCKHRACLDNYLHYAWVQILDLTEYLCQDY